MSRWRRTARAGCWRWPRTPCAIIGIELLAAAQGCDFHAPLDLERGAGGGARAAAREVVPQLDDDRYFHPDIEAATAPGAQRRGRRRGRRRAPARARGARDDATSRLADRRARRRAADRQLPAYRHRSAAELEPALRLARGSRARMPTGGSTGSTISPRDLGATIVRTRLSRSVIDVNRDPCGASLYPGQATTGLCPTDDLRRRAALSRRRRRPTRPRSPSAGALYFDPYHAALRGEIARLRARSSARRALRRAIRSARASRACSTASCRRSTSAPTAARAATPALRDGGRAALLARAATATSSTAASRAAGPPAHYGAPSRRRPRDPDGAGLRGYMREP